MNGMTYSEWLKWRMGGIGASEAPAVMDSTPFSNPLKLWELKTGRRAPDPLNYPMKRGLELEPKARLAYEKETGIRMKPKVCLEHPEMPFIRASYDGLNIHAERGLEIKCPGRVDHGVAKQGKIPEKYLWQCVHLLMVCGYEQLDYFSFDGSQGVVVPFKRDKSLEKKLLQKELVFWEHVQTDTPPARPQDKPVDSHNVFKVRARR